MRLHDRARELASMIPADVERKELSATQLCEKIMNDYGRKIAEVQTLLNKRIDGFEAEFRHQAVNAGDSGAKGFAGYETPGARLLRDSSFLETFAKSRNARAELKTFWPNLEHKTLIDSAALGLSTPGILGAERVSPIVALPQRRLTVRDLLRSRQVTGAQVDWIRENVFTNAASPAVESNAKAESADTFVIASAPVRTIAHWIPISRQAFDDLQGLRDFIDQNLIYGLKLKEETELLSGDGLGVHLSGLITQASAYNSGLNVSGDTKLDKLRHYITDLESAEDQCNGFILNPVDTAAIDLIKTEEGGANKGAYIVADPLGSVLKVRTYWGVPVVSTNSMPSGHCLAGDFSKAIIGDRMDATVDLSESHDTYFTENKIAIRAEERLALCVLRATAFRYGAI